MGEPINLKTEIEALCDKAGIPPNDVAYLAISPMSLVVFYHDRPVKIRDDGQGAVENVKVIPYVWGD